MKELRVLINEIEVPTCPLEPSKDDREENEEDEGNKDREDTGEDTHHSYMVDPHRAYTNGASTDVYEGRESASLVIRDLKILLDPISIE